MSDRFVVTVTGAIPADQLGATLAHEHLYCDISTFSGKDDNRLTASSQVIDDLAWFLRAGGKTIIEVTPVGIGRNPQKLREISLAAGVQVVAGIAFYDEATYPDWVSQAEARQVADYFIEQLEVGEDGVRAGVIGEITSHNEPLPNPSGYRLRELEGKVFVAAAIAQLETGAAITTHASLGRAGHAQLNLLEKNGANLERVIIGHCDAHWHEDSQKDLDYYRPMLDRGACCQFDLIGWTEICQDDVRADRLATLISLGYENQLLLSTDTCRLSQLRSNGGRGFDYLWTSFLPRLKARGVSDAQLDAMLTRTPERMFARV